MSPQELQELARLANQSSTKGNAYVQALCDRYPSQAHAMSSGAGGRAFVVNRAATDFPTKHARNDKPGYHQEAMVSLLQHSGCGPEIARLMELHKTAQPPAPHLRVPDKSSVAQCTTVVSDEPDVQALSCLRLLSAALIVNDSWAWCLELAAARLETLLLQYPALMHPRILFDEVPERLRQQSPEEPVPMMHAIARCNWARLPSVHGVTSEEALQEFALAPVVAYGLASKAPALTRSVQEQSQTFAFQGRSVAELLARSNRARPMLADSLLRMQRAVYEYGANTGLFASSIPMADSFRRFVVRTLKDTWAKDHRQDVSPVAELRARIRDSLVQEARLAVARSVPAPSKHSYAHIMMLQVTSLLYEPATGHDVLTGTAPVLGASLPVTDVSARLERFVTSALSIGAFQTEGDVALAITRKLLPIPDDLGPGEKHGTYDSTTFELAKLPDGGVQEFLSWLLEHGVPADELSERVGHRFTEKLVGEDNTWRRAMTAIVTSRAMTAAISARVALAGANVTSAVAAPRRHGV